jgi:tetratricopeptide (TPR) repeat protein
MHFREITLILALCCAIAVSGCATNPRKDVAEATVTADDPIGVKAAEAFEAGDRQVSLELYRQLLSREPENPVYLNNMGVILLQSGKPKEALEVFEQASIIDPANPDYLVNVGFARLRTGDNEEALTFFDHALEVKAGYARPLYGKGLVYMAMDEPEIALGMFHRAVAAEPHRAEYLFMKAYAAQQTGLWDDALAGYGECIGLSEDRIWVANAYSNRALCRFQLKEYDQGMEDLSKALELDETNAIYYYNRAQGFQMQHKYEQAIKDYTRAIAWRAGFPEAYINRGELYYLSGNESKGCSDFGRACELGYCGAIDRYEANGQCKDVAR